MEEGLAGPRIYSCCNVEIKLLFMMISSPKNFRLWSGLTSYTKNKKHSQSYPKRYLHYLIISEWRYTMLSNPISG
ncbi:hypothetical protein RND71_028458 [Anisodus tanguticus]|uniref:Uncharacterized protein n=1 Tax=Anisodus tanguticus TaxID=243964 RepID=A0AAE1RIG6_9SOLA|nr:hypothetical protein RND71_028458 [Anisodus tanguticus]